MYILKLFWGGASSYRLATEGGGRRDGVIVHGCVVEAVKKLSPAHFIRILDASNATNLVARQLEDTYKVMPEIFQHPEPKTRGPGERVPEPVGRGE